VREDAAAEERAEFTADEAGQRLCAVGIVGASEEGAEMPGHAVKECAFFGPPPLAARFDSHAGGVVEDAADAVRIVVAAGRVRGPRQWGQVSTSTRKTRRSNSAQE
jgi:hypothetical protein